MNPTDTFNPALSALQGSLLYTDNFDATATFIVKTTNNCFGLVWANASNQRVCVQIFEDNGFRIFSQNGSSNEYDVYTPYTVAIGDIVTFKLVKNGNTVTAICIKNGDLANQKELSITTTVTSGYLGVHGFTYKYQTLKYLAITTTSYASRAGEAEVANSARALSKSCYTKGTYTGTGTGTSTTVSQHIELGYRPKFVSVFPADINTDNVTRNCVDEVPFYEKNNTTVGKTVEIDATGFTVYYTHAGSYLISANTSSRLYGYFALKGE